MQIIAAPHERTTAATDAIMGLIAARYAIELGHLRRSDPWKIGLWQNAYGAFALSSVIGAFTHGFVHSEQTHKTLWRILYPVLGGVVALFATGAVRDGWGEPAGRRALPAFLLSAGGFFVASEHLPGGFRVFLAYEAVAMLFALGVYVRLARAGQLQGAELMAAAVLISIIAAAAQASSLKVNMLGVPFDNNGLFHLIQMAGLPVLNAGLRAALEH